MYVIVDRIAYRIWLWGRHRQRLEIWIEVSSSWKSAAQLTGILVGETFARSSWPGVAGAGPARPSVGSGWTSIGLALRLKDACTPNLTNYSNREKWQRMVRSSKFGCLHYQRIEETCVWQLLPRYPHCQITSL